MVKKAMNVVVIMFLNYKFKCVQSGIANSA